MLHIICFGKWIASRIKSEPDTGNYCRDTNDDDDDDDHVTF